jgi:hypothetical protein
MMLSFSEIRRLFTHTSAAILENFWDWRTGHTLKVGLGVLLMYGGAFALYVYKTGCSLSLNFDFPYLLPTQEPAAFFRIFGLSAGSWLIVSFMTALTHQGDVFPPWVTRTFNITVQLALFAAWLATGYWIYRHLGGNGWMDVIAAVWWATAALEIKRGTSTGGWGMYVGSSEEEIEAGNWSFGVALWQSLDLQERPILFIMTVLLTLGMSALFCLGQ